MQHFPGLDWRELADWLVFERHKWHGMVGAELVPVQEEEELKKKLIY